MKTLIAVPCMDNHPFGFTQSLMNMDKPEGTAVCFKANSLVYDSRCILSLTAIEQDFDRVMWIDSDMILPPDAIRKLHADMDNYNVGMVSGLYFKRKFPTGPVIYKHVEPPKVDERGIPVNQLEEYSDYPHDAIFPIQGCGFGCVMTSVSLLKKVWDKFGPAFIPYPWAGEDISFCHKVNLIGEKILCDSTIKCGHIGQFVYTEDLYLKNRGDSD